MTGPLLPILGAAAALLSQTPQAEPQQQSPNDAFQEVATAFSAFHLYFNPVRASSVGGRDYDARLPDVGRTALLARADAYQTWLDRLREIDASGLVGDPVQDRVLMEHAIRSELTELVEIRSWERDPAYYLDILSGGVATLVEDTGIPARDRMLALTSRLRQVPTVLAEARANLVNPPAAFTARGAVGARRLAAFVEERVPATFSAVEPGPAKTDLDLAVANAVAELDAFRAFLADDLAARSSGDARLGNDRLGWLLTYREHVEAEPGQIVAILEREIRDLRDRSSGPSRTEAALPSSTASPDSETVVGGIMSSARDHIFRSLFVTIPSDTRPRVARRPPIHTWDRGGVWGPGALQPYDGPATLYVLEVDDGSAPADARTDALVGAFPGAFLASMYARRAPTRLRKVLRPPHLDAAWAHYAVDAMIEDGFEPDLTGSHTRARMLALAEARSALLFHMGETDADGAAAMIAADAGVSPSVAAVAAARVAHRPLDGGILGALQIANLRRDFMRPADGGDAARSERRFHDAFLASGLPPTLARSVLLTDASAPALR